MIGALTGLKKIPEKMLDKLLKFDCLNNGFRRPEFLSVRINALKNIKMLIKTRP
jgi:hypothetical protein